MGDTFAGPSTLRKVTFEGFERNVLGGWVGQHGFLSLAPDCGDNAQICRWCFCARKRTCGASPHRCGSRLPDLPRGTRPGNRSLVVGIGRWRYEREETPNPGRAAGARDEPCRTARLPAK